MEIRNSALAFAGGVVAAHGLPAAHPFWPYILLAGTAALACRRLRIAALVSVGLGWGAWAAVDAVTQRVSAACQEAVVTGQVVDLPALLQTNDQASQRLGQRFVLVPQQASCELPGPVRLTWFEGPSVRGGELWRLRVRLKPPRSVANWHGFDAEKWFARNGLAATGYVLSGVRLSAGGGIDGWREALRDGHARAGLVNGGVLGALALGDSAAIPDSAVNLYRRTATMHLLVISGLHVGIVTALGFFLGRWCGLLLGVPAKASGVATALLLAGGYVLLAGAGLSLVRAFAMAAVGMLALVAGRTAAASAVFAYALALVLAVDPMAPLAAGFWLSFGAVGVLLGYFAPRPRPRSWLLSALAAQLVIAVVFLPVTTVVTGLIHPLSIPVNLVAVPVVTMLVVPLALAGTALVATPLGTALLLGADFGVSLVGEVLAFADGVAPLHIADPGWRFPWAVAASLACLLPVSRWAGVALAASTLALLCVPRPASGGGASGAVDVTVLDVGQGTAVLVSTTQRLLVYDTGPAFPTGGDMGTNVLLPTLRARGVRSVDTLVLSHGDIDHVGGASAVLEAFDVATVLAGEPVDGVQAERCLAGMGWRWDGVDFTILSPRQDDERSGNNASCVLLIETATSRVLLAGDIERAVERGLRLPAVDVVLVPHHGSATSSTVDFVAAVRPRFAVVTAAFANRFGHPHPKVVTRYRDVGAHVLTTAESGALRWNSARPLEIRPARCRASPYWRQPARRNDGNGEEAARAALLPCRIPNEP